MQLTNILRDVREDSLRGRIYLPLDELERFGYTENDLERGVVNEPFRRLMRYQATRAREHFERGRRIVPAAVGRLQGLPGPAARRLQHDTRPDRGIGVRRLQPPGRSHHAREAAPDGEVVGGQLRSRRTGARALAAAVTRGAEEPADGPEPLVPRAIRRPGTGAAGRPARRRLRELDGLGGGCTTPARLATKLNDRRVSILVMEIDFVFGDVFEAAPHLEFVGICRAAVNHVDVEAATAQRRRGREHAGQERPGRGRACSRANAGAGEAHP